MKRGKQRKSEVRIVLTGTYPFFYPIPVHNSPKYRPQVALLRAFGNERRFATADHLAYRIFTVMDVAKLHGISFSSTSRYLHVLRKAGVLKSIRKAGNIYIGQWILRSAQSGES